MINIEKFNGFDIEIEYQKVNEEYADKCCDVVKQKANHVLKQHRGRYVSGWTTRIEKYGRSGQGVVVYNATDWQLTHLLENGHEIVNKKDGTGWSAPRPHIKPAYRSLKGKYLKALNNVEIKIEAK